MFISPHQFFLLTVITVPIVLLCIDRFAIHKGQKTLESWITPVLFGLVIAVFWFLYSPIGIAIAEGRNDFIEPWHNFHYYLNAKYFDELGYFDLYTCALRADSESSQLWDDIRLIRDLNTYELARPSDLPECPVSAFTQNRWETFKQDFVYMQSLADSSFWGHVLRDKGYNPSPFYTVVGKTLAQRIHLSNTPGIAVLFNLDVLMIAVALVVAAWSLGARTALFMGLFILLYFGTHLRLAGNFLQYSWLATIIVGISLWFRRRVATGSMFLAYALMVRVFPVFIIIGAVVQMVYHRVHISFLKWFGLWSLLFIGIGSLTNRGLYAWYEFILKMALHSKFIVEERFNIGLKNLLGTLPISPLVNNLLYGLAVILVGYIFYRIAIERHVIETAIYGAIGVYFLLTVSPYYLIIFALVPLIHRVRTSPRQVYDTWGWWSLLSLWLLLFVNVLFNPDAFISLLAISRFITELSILLFCVVILIGGYCARCVRCSNASQVQKSLDV